jgi:hypothetical protein
MYLGILQISMNMTNKNIFAEEEKASERRRREFIMIRKFQIWKVKGHYTKKKHAFYIFHNLVEFRYDQLFATPALICFFLYMYRTSQSCEKTPQLVRY